MTKYIEKHCGTVHNIFFETDQRFRIVSDTFGKNSSFKQICEQKNTKGGMAEWLKALVC